MRRHTYTARERLCFNGTTVEPGDVVAVIETEFRITNISAAIRMDQLVDECVELPPAKNPVPTSPSPPANETTTCGAKPSARVAKDKK